MIFWYKLLLLDWSYNVAPLAAPFSKTSIRYFQNNHSSFCGLLSCVEIDGRSSPMEKVSKHYDLYQFKKTTNILLRCFSWLFICLKRNLLDCIIQNLLWTLLYNILVHVYFQAMVFSPTIYEEISDKSSCIHVQRIAFIQVD